MAARSATLARAGRGLAWGVAALLLGAGTLLRADAPPQRIISVIPAATEMLFAIGAGRQVVGVGTYDEYPPQVEALPRVGALIDPDVEKMLSLKPDLVVVYATQTDLEAKLARAHIPVYEYRHAGLSDITETIRALGERTGHAADAERVAAAIEHGLTEIRQRVSQHARPRTLLVFGRERLALRGIYVSGGRGFLDDMLRAAGGENVFADIDSESVQATTEQILARRPDVILEIRASDSAWPFADRSAEVHTWDSLTSVPAVRNHRVQFLVDDRLVIPGPRVVEGTRLIAEALHPEAFK
jgi:iron complex transport system substrate-binding protein